MASNGNYVNGYNVRIDERNNLLIEYITVNPRDFKL